MRAAKSSPLFIQFSLCLAMLSFHLGKQWRPHSVFFFFGLSCAGTVGPFFHFGHIGWPTNNLHLNHLKIQSHQFQFSLILSINVYSPSIVVGELRLTVTESYALIETGWVFAQKTTYERLAYVNRWTRKKKTEERIVCTQHGIYDDGLQLCAINFFFLSFFFGFSIVHSIRSYLWLFAEKRNK